MLPFMRFCLLLLAMAAVARSAPMPEAVAVLYNSEVPESGEIARIYAKARFIPEGNLIGLPMPKKAEISREEYETAIRNPLREEFGKRAWWKLGRDAEGIVLPVENRIRVLVTIRGVPLKIAPGPKPEAGDAENPIASRDDASVDSELAMFGVEGVPAAGVLKNMFFESKAGIAEVNLPFLVLTARIDAASRETCERMIRDAISTENTGLWGMAYVDIANKFPQGDDWLRGIVKANEGAGIPTVVDRFNDTLPLNYPMTEASVYYGWYDWHVSGPFLNGNFRFRPGAVAVHLHSFSGAQISDAMKNWCAPLLEKGAAVTVGNVYEPYLHLTHHLNTLHRRLLDGHSWVEAAWMSVPVVSWQGIVLGDPLYRPFAHLDGTGEIAGKDMDFRALRAAVLEWKDSPAERHSQIGKAGERTGSGFFEEALGLELRELGLAKEAAEWFARARSRHEKPADRMRQDFHLAAIERGENRKEPAIRLLREAKTRYGEIPEAKALDGWLDLLDPPPPADPAKPASGNP